MSIYKTSVNKPISVLMICLAVIVLGVFSLTRLPIDFFPEIEPPYVSVMTTYQGANGNELETNVTKLLENSLNSVDGLKEITSTSKDNISVVTLEFQWGYNLDEAVNDIRSSIDMVYDNLPDGCSRPMVFKFNTSMMPIIQYAVTAKESYSGLQKIMDDNVINVLNRIDGIGAMYISGAPERYVYIDLDPNKVDAYGLSLEMIGQAIGSNNLNLAAGSVKMGKEHYQMRVQGEYIESHEINNIVVGRTLEGKSIFLRDIATVRDTIRDLTLEEKIDGKDGARLVIMKQSGANTVTVAEKVRTQLAEIQKKLPPDIHLKLINDTSENIENAISGLEESILFALIFVVLVILFFLGRWRATIIISITIPIALLSGFIYLALVGSSLNIISLCSLTIAIGMVVDDAIVVLENIMTHIDRGSNPREAAIYATNEVWVSVIATTLVIVAVFVPLTMLGGQAGILFKELGWIVTIVVCVSTVVAITLTPMLSSKLLKAKKILPGNDVAANDSRRRFTYQNTVVRFLNRVDEWYARALRVCLRHKLITLLVTFGLFFASLVPFAMGKIGANFMPEQDQGQLSVSIELQRGTRVEETSKTAREIEKNILKLVPETELISTSCGSSDESGFTALFTNTNNNKISMTVRLTKKYDRQRTIWQIAEVIRQDLALFPEIINYQVSTGGGGFGGNSNALAVEIYGFDFDKTNALAAELKQRCKDVAGARDIMISREEDRAELQVVFDKEKLALNGLNEATVSTYVRNRINGMTVGLLKEDGDEYRIVVRLQEEYRNSLTAIEEITIMTPQGKQIKLKELAQVKEYWSPPSIARKSRERIVTVNITPQDVSLQEMAIAVQKEIDALEIPQGILVNIGGAYEDQQETFADMITLGLLILMLVYIVMASQFESLTKPFIIMMAVPFAITGVIAALLITGTSLDIIGALGIILLIGIVVKNGIVLVDYTNLMRDRGYELNEAIALSGRSRLRPVLMTAVTTILGMVPMAISTSEGSEMWKPMGIVVIGGLTVSTIITLIVVPVFYAVMSRHGERDKEKTLRKQFQFMDRPLNENSK